MLYAAGYKLAKNKLSIERTGLFILDSQPEGAKILIDGQTQQNWLGSFLKRDNYLVTPAKVTNLLPDEYEVSLELPGYWTWSKKLTINPGASTFAENIYLFKNDLPAQIIAGQIKAFSLAPDKSQLAILLTDQLYFLDLKNEEEKNIKHSDLRGKTIVWSEDQSKIVIDNFLYDLTDLAVRLNLNKIAPLSFNYKWQENVLYFQDKNSIYRLGADNLAKKIINIPVATDYLIKNGNLYLINQAGKIISLEIIDLATKAAAKTINLPFPAAYSFINSENGWLNIFDDKNKILYLLNQESGAPQLTAIDNVKTASWINDDQLLYFNDYEIWLYNKTGGEKTLITRISQPITAALLHPNKNYIIYSTEQTVNSIELDQREKRNLTELIKFDKINYLSLSADGKILYFAGSINKAQGLYKLLLQ